MASLIDIPPDADFEDFGTFTYLELHSLHNSLESKGLPWGEAWDAVILLRALDGVFDCTKRALRSWH
ncbi:hypothetical protein A3B18_00240 [Candidatus Giovannonibacteria bacterium RIFCSPLOWO2_01_FULL_46_13]|uniref:Uncharacterized protein n=1 Tax=Candidatus Giovannonibacteria bacterium RIFCSPLOWO2_01_FULL_46_13 TaxID=1798352 RepID=A0A1F5X4L6_9BACT|nr:MAG: hypothetical protein A3B18_00240 [Candidatus Giovannonibacteria bacterium RIFCSPLOWO2_01_FULL_46_13]